MTQFTPEIIEIAKAKFGPLGIEMGEVKDRLVTIYEQPFMAQMKNETERQMASLKILMAQIIASIDRESFSKTETILMRIEGKEEVTPFKRQDGTESYRSNLYVTAVVDEKPMFGQLTLWGDANDMHPGLKVGKIYLIPVIINGKDPLSLSINDASDIEEAEEDIPLLMEIIKNDFSPIDIRDMEFNISRDWSDLRLVKGTAIGSWMKITKNDKNMGFLKMVGDDQNEITVIKFSRNAEQVMMYGIGSLIYVLGQITNAVLNSDGVEKYPVGMWGNLIIPILTVPPETKETQNIEAEGGFTKDDIDGW
jgi:hypothetical protein